MTSKEGIRIRYKVVHVVPGQVHVFEYEVLKITKTTVHYFDGGTHATEARISNFYRWFKSREAADAYALEYAQEQLRLCQGLVDAWRTGIKQLKGIK